MLETFQMIKVGFAFFSRYTISRKRVFFKRAHARVRGKNGKMTKIAGNGLSGRFDTMLGNEKFAKLLGA